jgi:DNA-binding IclR family transcriptional regulator
VADAAKETSSSIQVIARAAAVLRALKGSTTGVSLGQLATELSLPRSTVQRIVSALQREHLVIAASPNGGIRLGPEIMALAAAGRIDTVDFVHPYLQALSERTGETVDMAVLRGAHLIFVDQVAGSQRLRAITSVGESFPLHNSANGKAVLAHLEDDAVVKLLAASRDYDDVDVSALLRELSCVRTDGVAFDLDEHTSGISALGAAVVDSFGDVYAISIPTPSARFNSAREQLTAALHDTLCEIRALPVITC